jgi:hypothetical protein
MSILTNVEECTVDETLSVYRYDDVLLLNESTVLRWEQRGSDIVLIPRLDDGEEIILTRTGSDCHSLP